MRITGTTEKKLLGKRVEEIIPDPQAAKFVIQQYHKAIEQRKSIVYEEAPQLLVGKLIVETTIHPIFHSNGNCTHLLGVARDITIQKQTEDMIKQERDFSSTILD